MAAKKDGTGGDDVGALFQLPLTEFTAARDALVAKLKKAGRTEDAAKVKTLEKPPISAWAVNQLYWRHRREFLQLLEAGDRFREAQRAQLAGKRADLRGTLEAQRLALTQMTTRAADVLREADHSPTPQLMRRIATTLETLATLGSRLDGLTAGHLSADIEPAGFDVLATLVPGSGSATRGDEIPRVIPFTQRPTRPPRKAHRPRDPAEAKRQREAELAAKRAAARKALQAAEQSLGDARRAAQQAEAALKTAAARAKTAERQRAELEKRFEKAASEAGEAGREARRIAREAEEAAQAVSDAEQEVERARAQLAALR